MTTTTKQRREKLLRLVTLAVFAALAYACQFVFRIHVSFLTFDAKDAIMAIAAMIFGPIAGVTLSLLVALLEFLTLSGTGVYGLIMNFASSAAFTVICAGVYKHKRTMSGAVMGLGSAVLGTTAVMMGMNLLVTPYYMTGGSVKAVIEIIPTLLLPFNLTKTLMNAGLTLILYRPVSLALKRARILPGKCEERFVFDKTTVAVLIGGLALIALCVTVFLVILKGNVTIA